MPRFLPVSNPQNRFVSTSLEYDEGEAPGAELEIYEDQSRSILSTNDSPDVGFRWSVNPYRGCQHSCAYCIHSDTPILMADGRTKRIADLRVGEWIYGTQFHGKYRRYTRTQVKAHWSTVKRAFRIVLRDGTELLASADHRFLTLRGWKHVVGSEQGPLQRPHLTIGAKLMGMGAWVATPPVTGEYMRGYLCGIIRGDGLLFEREYERSSRGGTRATMFRLALVDLDGLRRTRRYLEEFDGSCSSNYLLQSASTTRKRVVAMRTSQRRHFELIREAIRWPNWHQIPLEWARGFLAGIFDAEGSFGDVIRISNKDLRMIAWTRFCLEQFGFDAVLEGPQDNGGLSVRIRGGLREEMRFIHLVDPAIRRKVDLGGTAIKSKERLEVASITDTGLDLPMFDITTGTGDFIANGVVSHNCYARPTHEYLSLGAGTDFERKIVVKRSAPALLRESFDKKSWKGELIVFSGITDCYQPLESKLRLTRGCLEVCAEYRNPVGVITKSPVIERDIDILQELARVASVRVSVSVPFWDPDVAKAMEPMVTTPERRMKIIETLAKAGIPVGISVSPIIPGLNDDHLGEVIERARDAGARHAFYVLLRLPGAVKEVFEAALREKLPLRADKVLRRLREAHGGKLYDSSYGARGRGEGVYADMIRKLFERTTKRSGLNADELTQYESPSTFRRPAKHGQTSFDF